MAVTRRVTAAGGAFVGRGSEVERLLRLLGEARRGRGQVAVIAGPAGIGKTRLAEEVLARARRGRARVAIGQCWHGEAPPLWPWLTILRQLGAPAGLLDDGTERGRFARFVAVLEYLRASGGTPFVIVVDDAHLGDPATLLLVRFLARERHGLTLLLMLTRREPAPDLDPEAGELLAELDRQAVSIPLSALSEEAVGRYLSAAGLAAPDAELRAAVAAVTGGNPLHLRSLALQSGLAAGGLRGGLEQAVGRLLAQLSAEDRGLAGVAAVLGPDVAVHEVARVAATPPALVVETLARARELGLLADRGAGRLAFIHEQVREAAEASLSLSERLDAHAQAALLVSAQGPEGLLRRAHHALAAASRSRKDAALAVAIAREAARGLLGRDGFESAAALLGRAVDIQQAAALTGTAAELLTERAEAVLACGRLAEARALFRDAVRVAEAERDPRVLARAALGSGGVWLAEHRGADEAERVLALQRRALEALPADAAVLRARLALRLAAEQAYPGGPDGPVLEALGAVRATGDAQALAEALSLSHNVLLTPEHTWRRLPLANEMIAAAAAAGDGLRALLGLCWRTADLFLLGDRAAVAALEELRLRADALRCRSVLFIARTMEVMLAIRAGRLDEAEQAAEACFALGTEVGDVDALAYHAAHRCAIRFFQGREAELAPMAATMAASPTLIARERSFAVAAALFALRAGQAEPARSLLQELARDGLGAIPMASSWLVTMLAVAEMTFQLADDRRSGGAGKVDSSTAAVDERRVAQSVYDALLPYAELAAMGSVAVVCFGSVHRSLGIARLATGTLDLAVEHLSSAVAANERLGHRPAAIQARAELALARLRRARGDDLAAGRSLLQQALDEAEAAGMDGLAARWRQASGSAAPGPHERGGEGARMVHIQAGRWRVVHEGEVATVPDRIGMRYLAQLVAAPGQRIPALALVAHGAGAPEVGTPDAVLDRRALSELRDRARALRQRPELSPGEEDELAGITEELARATGLSGRARSFADAPERARIAVRKAIKRAIDEIVSANPAVGRHLAARIETGGVCCYLAPDGPSDP
jgi:hypothetical protein